MSVFRGCMSSVLGARQIFWSIRPPYSSAWKRKKEVSKLEGQNVRKSKAFSEGLPRRWYTLHMYITYDYIIKTCIYIYMYIFTNRCFFDPFRIQNDSRIIINIASTNLFLHRWNWFTKFWGPLLHKKNRVPLGNLHKKPRAAGGNVQFKTSGGGVQKFILTKRQPRVLFHSKRVLKIFCFFPTLEMENFWAKTIGCTHGSSRWISGPWSSRRMTVLDKHPPFAGLEESRKTNEWQWKSRGSLSTE